MTNTSTPLSAQSLEIIFESTAFDGTPPVSDQALLAAAKGRRRLIEAHDALGIIGEGEIDVVVRPSARGRGIGRGMLKEVLEGEDQHAPCELRAWAHGDNPAATALLGAGGFTPVRELLRLSLDPALLASAIERARVWPEGFELRSFDPVEEALADDWVRVNSRAFASHPEQGAVSRVDFDALTKEPWFLAADLRLAYRAQHEGTATLAGFTWVKTVKTVQAAKTVKAAKDVTPAESNESSTAAGSTETELYVLGVDPAFSGIGLGAALLGETLRRMQLHHPDRITLYVDGDNTTAVELYQRAGFEVQQRSVQYLLKMTR